MGYLRIFIELRQDGGGDSCGQARVELQDRPGRVDCKVRCALMGLPAGASYEAALVSEQGGQYREYPLGTWHVNSRGQAGLMFRGTFPAEPLGVAQFKAIVARGSGKRVVGYRFDPLPIPDSYEEPVRSDLSQGEAAGETKVQSESLDPAEVTEEVSAADLPAEKEAEEEMQTEEGTREAVQPQPVEATPVDEPESAEPVWKPLPEPAPRRKPQTLAPQALYVIRELSQVEAVCGQAGRRAFERYHHLVLLQSEGESYLGMPCRYRPSQQMELGGDGYTEFYTPHGGAPTYGEFGYWVKQL